MSKKQVIKFIFILVSLLSRPVLAEVKTMIQKKVESSRLNRDQLALILSDPKGEVLFSLNENKKMIPASLTKIVTAVTTFENFPVGHQFVTHLLSDPAKIKNNVLQGDLYLRGGGDSTFVSESMWFLVNEFLRNDITKIEGNIVVDDSRFDDIRFDSSRDPGRVDRAYDAPIGAMTFNWSAINIFVRPAATVGESARVYVDPINSYIKVVNRVKTVSKSGKTKIQVSNNGLDSSKDFETVSLSGQIALGSKEFVAYKSVQQPDVWAGHQLAQFLKQRNITFNGKILRGETPSNATILAERKSKPIGEVISDMLKYSNNYIAEILTKNLSVHVHNKKGSMADGVQVIREYLQKNEITDFELHNPSGLSRKNKFRASDLLQLQRRIKSQFGIYPEYLSGLPIAGVDGTLRRRIKGEDFVGRVRAKTGYLTGVVGLSGFVADKAGNVYPFVFMFNGSADGAYRARDLFDEILYDFLKKNVRRE